MSDIDVKGSLEALRPLVRQARAAQALSEKLESLVGLDQHKGELERAVTELQSKVEGARNTLADAEAEAVRVCNAAKDKAAEVLQEASDAAERCVADAEQEARAIITEARSAVEVAQTENELARQTGRVLQAEVDSLTETRATLTAQIADLKSVASRIVG